MGKHIPLLIGLIIAAGLLATQCLFVVHQTEKALVIQLGDPVDRIYGPGLHGKLPFIQNVITFDARVLDYEARAAEALTSDKKTIVLDNYARWRIVDPLQFYRSVRTIPGAQARLDDVVYSQLRAQVGRHTLTEVVSSKRSSIMADVTRRTSEIMKEYGIEVVDVRIKRTDLPAENQRAIFGRMRAERERQAKQYRSEGVEESTKLRSLADRERAVLMAEANRRASVIRGEGDATAARVFAEAFSRAP
ncbi:MAG: protease modulator HflC, partial [Bilophila sp.]